MKKIFIIIIILFISHHTAFGINAILEKETQSDWWGSRGMAIATGDVDDDGKIEIIVVGPSHYYATEYEDNISIWSVDNGVLNRELSYKYKYHYFSQDYYVTFSGVCISDVDNDGKKEIGS